MTYQNIIFNKLILQILNLALKPYHLERNHTLHKNLDVSFRINNYILYLQPWKLNTLTRQYGVADGVLA